MDVSNDADEKSDALTQFLTFELGHERFGINILHIREIIEYKQVTTVPMMPAFITGVINLRGNVVPVINLASRFGKGSTELTKRTSVVIVELEQNDTKLEAGVVVDVVNAVLDIAPSDIEPAPSFGSSIRTDFIEGMGKVEEGLLILLNMNNILSVDELSAVVDSQQST
ncbi:MAG: purine-binding chemotaxis protein CheW [Methylococcales bacterium]|nr:purine-binding chemotaxis protein CheW [Methylococcales bacterium]MBT7442457.1 purine-binding chemotaxis protein CheW [Methylococcales bacterium]